MDSRQGHLQRKTYYTPPQNNEVLLNLRPRPEGNDGVAVSRVQRDWRKMSIDPPERSTQASASPIQAKLTIGEPNDVYEQEADRVADQVMNTPDSAVQNPIQREEIAEEEEVQTKPLADAITPLVQREEMPEEEEPVQAKLIQREAIAEDEEEPVQTKAIQREEMSEEEEPVQAKLIQREAIAEEEEEPVQPKMLQREEMPEDEESLQTKRIQREAIAEDEEESVQTKAIQREEMPEEEEPVQTKRIQREEMPEEEESVQTKAIASVQRKEGNKIQTKLSSNSMPNLESQLAAQKGGGSPLGDETRSFMESRFGTDFSQVRVHTDASSVQMNRALNAQAFTHGSDIYYGAGKGPGQNELTAHELTHVVQQTGEVHRKSNETHADVVNHLGESESPGSL